MDAMRVASFLDIPFLTFDFEDVYKKEVADYMINEYKIGRTPNPDVMCNKEVKFGAFLKKALSMGADFVATGHYAQNFSSSLIRGRLGGGSLKFTSPRPSPYKGEGEIYNLFKGFDSAKDQSYFLWTLRQEQLKKILFPIGNLKKKEVRKLAKKFNIPVAEKKDSQGICFLGAVDLKEFLKHYIKEKKGEVILIPSEEGENKYKVIGYHDGAAFYTLGERHGFTITKKMPTDGAYYVVGKDIKKNILFVSQNYSDKFTSPQLSPYKGERVIHLENINWINEIPKPNKNYTAQIRYHSEFLPCRVICQRPSLTSLSKTVFDIKTAKVIFKKPIIVASGQSCVVYDKDICIGGGVVV